MKTKAGAYPAMSTPHYTTAMTYNIWGGHAWPAREPALRTFLRDRPTDLLAIQELRAATRDLIDEVLTDHDRVHDDVPGWTVEGNLWWNRHLYSLLEYGAEDIGIKEQHRRLFWVRLASSVNPAVNLVFATAHLTWVGHRDEGETHINPRIGQMESAAEALNRIAGDTPCIMVGDFNDYGRTRSILFDAGFGESFDSLRRISPPTHPAYPTARPDQGFGARMPAAKPLDWQFHRGALRPVSAEVVEYWHEGIPPSDHLPVFTTYQVGEPNVR